VKGLEAINPSSLGKLAFGVMYGKTPDEIHRETQANIRQTCELTRRNIERTLVKLQKERVIVHGA
jgi:hypothetical protein